MSALHSLPSSEDILLLQDGSQRLWQALKFCAPDSWESPLHGTGRRDEDKSGEQGFRRESHRTVLFSLHILFQSFLGFLSRENCVLSSWWERGWRDDREGAWLGWTQPASRTLKSKRALENSSRLRVGRGAPWAVEAGIWQQLREDPSCAPGKDAHVSSGHKQMALEYLFRQPQSCWGCELKIITVAMWCSPEDQRGLLEAGQFSHQGSESSTKYPRQSFGKACVSGPARCSSEEPGLILVFLGGWSEREQGSMGRAGCVDPYGRKRLQIHAWASGVQGHHSRDGLISGQHQISWGWLDKSMW